MGVTNVYKYDKAHPTFREMAMGMIGPTSAVEWIRLIPTGDSWNMVANVLEGHGIHITDYSWYADKGGVHIEWDVLPLSDPMNKNSLSDVRKLIQQTMREKLVWEPFTGGDSAD
jgi:hypothetical protein